MQCFIRCKTVPILWIFLLNLSVFFASVTRTEAAVVVASPCTLAWNNSPDASVTGYALYYGIKGSGVTNRLNVGMTNLVTCYNLLASSNYFFYAVSYNASGKESLPSDVVSYRSCALSGLKLTKLANATMKVQFEAAPGTACHVQYTPSLAPPQWQTLCSATADAYGCVNVCDALATNSPARYYRAVLP